MSRYDYNNRRGNQSDLILVGATGRLGQSIVRNKPRRNAVSFGVCTSKNPLLGTKIEGIDNPLICKLKDIDLKKLDEPILIDASYPNNFENILDFCSSKKIPLILVSTGHTNKQLEKLEEVSTKIPILKASNLSEGIIFFKLALLKPIIFNIYDKTHEIAFGPDLNDKHVKIKIIETHHDKKKDAPSGTALEIKDYIRKVLGYLQNEIEIESIRDKSSIGKHEVIFTINNDEISVSHNALSRDIFGEGISLAVLIGDKEPGLYNMADLYEDLAN